MELWWKKEKKKKTEREKKKKKEKMRNSFRKYVFFFPPFLFPFLRVGKKKVGIEKIITRIEQIKQPS